MKIDMTKIVCNKIVKSEITKLCKNANSSTLLTEGTPRPKPATPKDPKQDS